MNDLTVNGTFSFPTTASSLTVSGATALNGTIALGNATADTITQTGHLTTGGNCNCDWSGSSGTFKTSTGTNTIGGDVSVAAGKDIAFAAGAGEFDMSSATGTFKTPTGAHTINGSATFAANKTLTMSATGGAINCNAYQAQDGTTAITLSGADVTCANDLDVTGTLTAGTITLASITTTGDIEVQGSDINAVAGTLNLSKSGSTTTVKGDFNVDEAATFDSTVGVTGNTTLTGSLTANGDVNLGNAKTDTTTLYGDIAADGTQNPDVDLSGSSGNFLTTTGSVTIGPGAVGISGDVTVTAGKDVVTSGAGYFQGANLQITSVKANDGTASFGIADSTGKVTVAANVDVDCAAGTSAIDFSSGTGTFDTPTGTNQLNGDVSIASGKDFDMSGGAGTFATGTGAVSIKGDMTLDANLDIVTSGSGYIQGVNIQNTNYKANDGTACFSIADSTGALTVGAGVDIDVAAGATNVDWSNSTGTFDTPTGTNQLNGDVSIAAGKNFDMSAGAGTCTTGTGLTTIGGDLDITGHIDGQVFCANAFQYPNPGTDWTPDAVGATLGANLAAKEVYIPLNFLKQGDEIVSYRLVGDVAEAAAVTIDCKLIRINKADPITETDVAGGGITQVDADGNFDSLATLSSPETVDTDKQYVLQITGTCGAGDAATVMGAEVTVNRKG